MLLEFCPGGGGHFAGFGFGYGFCNRLFCGFDPGHACIVLLLGLSPLVQESCCLVVHRLFHCWGQTARAPDHLFLFHDLGGHFLGGFVEGRCARFFHIREDSCRVQTGGEGGLGDSGCDLLFGRRNFIQMGPHGLVLSLLDLSAQLFHKTLNVHFGNGKC